MSFQPSNKRQQRQMEMFKVPQQEHQISKVTFEQFQAMASNAYLGDSLNNIGYEKLCSKKWLQETEPDSQQINKTGKALGKLYSK